MKYKVEKDKIIISDTKTFDIKSILDSGQMFRYRFENNAYIVQSGNKVAKICNIDDEKVVLSSKNVNYFANFFDINTNYDIILTELSKFKFMAPALKYYCGVRILKQ